MTRRYEKALYRCHYPCEACGEPHPAVWLQRPFPGHNLETLYECESCGAVFSLADITGFWASASSRALEGVIP